MKLARRVERLQNLTVSPSKWVADALSVKLGTKIFAEALFVLVTYWGDSGLEVSLHILASYRLVA